MQRGIKILSWINLALRHYKQVEHYGTLKGVRIVYCATRGIKFYFASVKFDARTKRGFTTI